jgi:hypothetical protein
MSKTGRVGVALFVVAWSWLVPAAPASATDLRHAIADLVTTAPGIYGADHQFEIEIEDAMDRFEAAGLELPPLRIFAHADKRGCEGHLGIYGQYGQRDRIDLCTHVEFYILHELGHAWEQHNVTDDVRAAILEETGLTVWHDRDLPWLDSGAEIAANTIAFGLLDLPMDEAETAAFTPQLERFRLLTGANSPRAE